MRGSSSSTDVDGRRRTEPPADGAAGRPPTSRRSRHTSRRPHPTRCSRSSGSRSRRTRRSRRRVRRAGDLLIYDAAKRGRVAWVAERFRQAGVKAEADACALLIEYVGEDDLHGLANEIDKIATWAHGEPVGVAEIEQLVVADRRRAVVRAHRRVGATPPRAPARPVRDALRPLRQAAPRHGATARRAR